MIPNVIPKIGEVGTADMGVLDAFHIPGMLVRSLQELWPGDRVRMSNTGKTVLPVEDQGDGNFVAVVGIIDPFLTQSIAPGESVWMLFMPGQTNGLRHVFDIELKGVATVGRPPQMEDDECRGCYD